MALEFGISTSGSNVCRAPSGSESPYQYKFNAFPLCLVDDGKLTIDVACLTA
jgi:hypothetical protein